MRAGEERPRRSDERSDLGECQGRRHWRAVGPPCPPEGGRGESKSSGRGNASQGRRAVRARMAASSVVRPWRAPCSARPWPNLRGDGRDGCRAGDRAEHQASQRQQGAWSAVLARKRGRGLRRALRGRGRAGWRSPTVASVRVKTRLVMAAFGFQGLVFQASGGFFLLVLGAGVVHQGRDRQITFGLRLLHWRLFWCPLHVRYCRLVRFRRKTVHIRELIVFPVVLRISLQIGTGILKQRLGSQRAFGIL